MPTGRARRQRERNASTTHLSIFTYAEINADVTETVDASQHKRQKVLEESELAAA